MIDQLIDDNEEVLWRGRPDFLIYVIGNPIIYPFALLWLGFDMIFINSPLANMPFFWPFIIFHLIPVWVAIFGPLVRAITYRTIEYAITDKRSYIVSGIFGRDVSVLEHRSVQELTVDVGFLEQLRRVGTLKFMPDTDIAFARSSGRGINHRYRFRAIDKPYEVYKMLKKVALDVATDQYYPNAYRPDNNPGYDTKLDDK